MFQECLTHSKWQPVFAEGSSHETMAWKARKRNTNGLETYGLERNIAHKRSRNIFPPTAPLSLQKEFFFSLCSSCIADTPMKS